VSLPATVTASGVTLALEITRKRVKNVNARLRGTTLLVSAPPGLPERELLSIVTALAGRLVRRVHARKVNSEHALDELVKRVAARFPQPPKVSSVAYTVGSSSRWGSYSATTGTVRLNAALRHMPVWVLESVVAHELAHAVHLDHSGAFWSLLRRVCPDTDRSRAFLSGVTWAARAWPKLEPADRAGLVAEED
jgi:predicted metal-dependent hydrolase